MSLQNNQKKKKKKKRYKISPPSDDDATRCLHNNVYVGASNRNHRHIHTIAQAAFMPHFCFSSAMSAATSAMEASGRLYTRTSYRVKNDC